MRNLLVVLLPMAAVTLSACITVQPHGPGLVPGTRTLTPDGPTPTPAVAAPLTEAGIHPIGLTPSLDH